MNTFREVEELISRIECGAITQPEALEQIAAARAFLSQVHNRLGRLARRLQDDPLTLWRASHPEGSE